MLGKLIKHEFRATSRIMLPFLLIILALTLGVIVFFSWDSSTNLVLQVFSGILMVAYVIALIASFIIILVLMINRFRTNLLGDEGYLTFTLPTSIHQIVWSKIIVSCVWFIATLAVVTLSGFIVSLDAMAFADVRRIFFELWDAMTLRYALNGTAIILEFLLLIFVSYASTCLQFYAAMALGYSFNRRKGLLSVAFFFGFQFVSQFLFSLLAFSGILGGLDMDLLMNSITANIGMMGSIHVFFLFFIVLSALYGAIFYFITTYCLKKRLNIE